MPDTSLETILKINISWQYWYPACSTAPWQLDGEGPGPRAREWHVKNTLIGSGDPVAMDAVAAKSWGQKQIYWGKLHPLEWLLLRTPLAPWSYAASSYIQRLLAERQGQGSCDQGPGHNRVGQALQDVLIV